jgi:hypothetical protein
MKKSTSILLCSVLVFVGWYGCGKRGASAPDPTAQTAEVSEIPWSDRLKHSEALIIRGPWNKAEVAWDRLRDTTKSVEERELWIAFQVVVLEETRNDPLKEELRETAIQEMYWHPKVSRKHRDWLEEGLRSGVLGEKLVRRKAQELLAIIDGLEERDDG